MVKNHLQVREAMDCVVEGDKLGYVPVRRAFCGDKVKCCDYKKTRERTFKTIYLFLNMRVTSAKMCEWLKR